MTKRPRFWIFLAALLVVGGVYLAIAAKRFLDEDDCMDLGGIYVPKTGACSYDPANNGLPREQRR